MAVVQCSMKHFYDNEIYSECPHCSKMAESSGMGGLSDGEDQYMQHAGSYIADFIRQNSLEFGREIVDAPQAPSVQQQAAQKQIDAEEDLTVIILEEECTAKEQADAEEDLTVIISEEKHTAQKQKDAREERAAQKQKDAREERAAQKQKDVREERAAQKQAAAEEKHTVQKQKDAREGHAAQKQKDAREEHAAQKQADAIDAPAAALFEQNRQKACCTVGWLVCTKGRDYGKDFSLHAGFNRIGRDAAECDIILKDECVSAAEHCAVFYDERKNVFYLFPNADYISYIDGQPAANIREIKSRQTIRIGDTCLEFAAFCEGDKSWG